MDIATEESDLNLFNRKLNKLLNKARIQDGTWLLCYKPNHMISNTSLVSALVFPTLLQDITNKADKWGNDGKSGRIDPFTQIYDVSFLQRDFSGLVLSLCPSARLRHDRPYGHLSRPDKE